MAAPLPSGSTVFAIPQAPQADPRNFALDPQGALLTAQAGLHLGTELASLDNQRAQRELEAAQIKAAAAKNAYDMKAIEHATTNLPTMVGAEVAKAREAAAASDAARALTEARVQQGLPGTTAEAEASAARNALAGSTTAGQLGIPGQQAQLASYQNANTLANAKADLSFNSKPIPARTQLLEAAKFTGGAGIPEGWATDTGGVPIPFRELRPVSEVDPETGNTVERMDIFDKRNGQTISKGASYITKLGVDEKSQSVAMREATAIVQSKDLANQLNDQLETYIKAGEGGLGQSLATNLANKAPAGPISVITKAAGAKAQTAATVALAGAVTNLRSAVDSRLSKEKGAQIQGMLPTVEDLSDPARAKEKLQSTIKFLDTLISPYEERGILTKGKMSAVASPNARPPAAAFGDAPLGTVKQVGTATYQMVIQNGVKGWARQK